MLGDQYVSCNNNNRILKNQLKKQTAVGKSVKEIQSMRTFLVNE